MRSIMIAAAAVALASGCATAEQTLEGVDKDTYQLDLSHASLVWKVSHFGLSDYTGRFTDFDATLEFDPENPTGAALTATVNPLSVDTEYPGDFKESHPDSKHDTWDEELAKGDKWLNGDEFPEITFESTQTEATGEFTGKVTGDLTFMGETKPVTLDVTYNGFANLPFAPQQDRIGFTATATLDRTEFGLGTFAPMIGATVDLVIQAEFAQPGE
jgi:polyisoprenoid-binding protein YceI